MKEGLIYEEIVSSNRTRALFIGLTILFLLLLIWRAFSVDLDTLAIVFFCFFVLFLFYSINYQTLIIHLTKDQFKLTFGVFHWTVGMENIEECDLDELPLLMRYGGAGIQFMMIHKRYRASFNFLEYPRVVIRFKKSAGLVRDLSFSTRHPYEIMRLIQEAIS